MTKMSKPTPNSGNKLLSEPVVFFGTGPVAAASLELLAKWAVVEAVITKPKPLHHKGSFPVLETAQELGLPVLPVTNRHELDVLVASRPVKARLGVLIDFGIIVSQAVIDYFPLGIVNSHFSLLPEWRGADPITFSILSGQKQTGVSLMLLAAGMDEGPLLGFGVQEVNNTTTPKLTEQLILLSDALLQTELARYVSGKAKLIRQEDIHTQLDWYPSKPSYSRKLTKEDGLLDFAHKPAAELEREVRAYAGWPKSRTTLAGKEVVITKAHVMRGQGSAGTLHKSGKELGFYTTDDIFIIDSLKPAGKPEMSAQAFLAGYHL